MAFSSGGGGSKYLTCFYIVAGKKNNSKQTVVLMCQFDARADISSLQLLTAELKIYNALWNIKAILNNKTNGFQHDDVKMLF